MPEPKVTLDSLTRKKCKPCEGGTEPMIPEMVGIYLGNLPGWGKKDGGIEKAFTFKNYYETMAFVNGVAFIAHREDHHPDMEVGYKTCKVKYTTHAIGGLSENDFICAAKVELLLK